MWYLYTLTYKEYVFYVGITKDPASRFAQHTYQGTPVYEYMYWIIERGEFNELNINIIKHYLVKDEARAAEEGLICYFASIKHKLCNADHNPTSNYIITCRPPYTKLPRKRIPIEIIELRRNYHDNILEMLTRQRKRNLYLNTANI